MLEMTWWQDCVHTRPRYCSTCCCAPLLDVVPDTDLEGHQAGGRRAVRLVQMEGRLRESPTRQTPREGFVAACSTSTCRSALARVQAQRQVASCD